MDQVKAILHGIFVKHQFWSISVVLVALGIAGWWMAAGQLKTQYETNKKTVTTADADLKTVISKPPDKVFNDTSHLGMEAKNAERREEVYKAWWQKYQKQRNYVLVWPEGLSKRFVDEIEEILKKGKNGTIEEVKVNANEEDPLVNNLREEYRDEIKNLLPKLAEMINARWAPQSGGEGPRRGFGARGEVNDEMAETIGKRPAVNWSSSSQADIESTYFDWAKSNSLMGGEQEPPTTVEILYSMEDYWVLKAIMQIIARTNVDADGRVADSPYKASIREIASIQIGKKAADRVGSVFKPAPAAADGQLPPQAQGPAAIAQQPAGGVGPAAGAGGAVNAEADPAERRYVDIAYAPLTAEKVRSAADSDNPDEAYLAVAKRMPVRLQVRIDQRKLNKFSIECGNADLMLEVIQVRVLPEQDVFTVSGNMQRGGGQNAFAGGRQNFGQNADDDDRKANIWDVDVEVYGIIYIFNPPSRKRLTSGLAAEKVKEFEAWADKEASKASQATQDEALDALNVPAADPPAAEPAKNPPANAPADSPAPPAAAANPAKEPETES